MRTRLFITLDKSQLIAKEAIFVIDSESYDLFVVLWCILRLSIGDAAVDRQTVIID